MTTPLKTALDAETDQALAFYRDNRPRLGDSGAFFAEMGDEMARNTREQFPGIRTGRIVMAIAQGLKAIDAACAENGVRITVDRLLIIAALAAEQLDREGA